MNDIEYKVQTLIEKRDFDKLTPAEREMVYFIMTEEEFTERREMLLQSENVFEEERVMLVPDASILASLKANMQIEDEQESEGVKGSRFAWLSYKVSLFKSAAAALLLLLGSYFVFANSKPNVQYIEKEIVVEKKIYDTIYSEKIVEVPVEKIVKVVKYIQTESTAQSGSRDVSFVVKELELNTSSKKVELKEFSNSYGNTKIDKSELEQFRVCL